MQTKGLGSDPMNTCIFHFLLLLPTTCSLTLSYLFPLSLIYYKASQ